MKVLHTEKLSKTLTLYQKIDGFWIWDDLAEMNLAMHCKTREIALLKVIDYYQRKTIRIETDLDRLNKATDIFIASVSNYDED